MKTTAARFGPLTCHLVAATQRPQTLVVLCHGFGAPGTDLVPLADALVRQRPALGEHVAFAFPEAPLDLSAMGLYGARAWWPLDAGRIHEAFARGDMRALQALMEDVPKGLSDARRAVLATLDALTVYYGVPYGDLVLGGFSQGSMVALDACFRLEEAPAAQVVWSGVPVAASEWRRNAPRRAGLPTLVSHGRQDQVLPLIGGQQLVALLEEAGLDVDFQAFDGPHTISSAALDRLGALLAARPTSPGT